MTLAGRRRFITTAALLAAWCFCLLSFTQLRHPFPVPSATTFVGPHQSLSRYAPEEVSPRGAKLPAHYAVGLIPMVLASPHGLTPRAMTRVTPGAIESWLIHQRTSPPPPDNSDPA